MRKYSRREALEAMGAAGLLMGTLGGCASESGETSQTPGDLAEILDVGDVDASDASDVGDFAEIAEIAEETYGPDVETIADADAEEPTLPESCEPTESDKKGPFYLEDAPNHAILAGPNEPGERIVIRGQVWAEGCTEALPGALVDVWQADTNGNYHMDSETYRLRAQILADADGRYAFESIQPGRYPMDGTMRPAHIHFTVSAPGYLPVTTQMYFEGDPFLAPNDPCSGCASDDLHRIVAMAPETKDGVTVLAGEFPVILEVAWS